jgi:integrase
MFIIQRGSKYYLQRRVPTRFAEVDGRTFVKISLRTDSFKEAEAKAQVIWEQLINAWEAKLAGSTEDAEQAFDAARKLADLRGFRYLDAQRVAKLPDDELRDRLLAVSKTRRRPGALPDRAEAAALLGGAAEPKITISRALELYWPLAKDRILGKSEDQIRRWRNPRIKAIKNLVGVIGDIPIGEITSDDMLEFRDWWLERLEVEKLTPGSANKDLIHAGDVLKTVNTMKRLGLVLPLSDLSFKKGPVSVRPPFSVAWIRDKLLAPRALDGLNEEARAILIVMINTGARPSEIAALNEAYIHLQTNVPHIQIEPDGRHIKAERSRRKIVLTGASLEAMRQFPEGFPRYKKSSATLSATVNKFLRKNALLETPDHTLYSLRHAFEDRMLAAGIDDRIRRDILGHRLTREQYGAGATLVMQQKLLQALAL